MRIKAGAIPSLNRLEEQYGFRILKAVPIDQMRREARGKPGPDGQRLKRFLQMEWPKVAAKEQSVD